MPFDAMIVSVLVAVVFVAFAAVLSWADSQTTPSHRRPGETGTSEIDAAQLRRRSF
jgi:hypothetical protein